MALPSVPMMKIVLYKNINFEIDLSCTEHVHPEFFSLPSVMHNPYDYISSLFERSENSGLSVFIN